VTTSLTQANGVPSFSRLTTSSTTIKPIKNGVACSHMQRRTNTKSTVQGTMKTAPLLCLVFPWTLTVTSHVWLGKWTRGHVVKRAFMSCDAWCFPDGSMVKLHSHISSLSEDLFQLPVEKKTLEQHIQIIVGGTFHFNRSRYTTWQSDWKHVSIPDVSEYYPSI
jgi:hypothetical protein